MSAKVLRTFALGRPAFGGSPASPAGERGLPQASRRPRVPGVEALRARAFGAGAPGSRSFAENQRFVTVEMRSFAASISTVRMDSGRNGDGRMA